MVWNIFYFFHILGIIIPTDFHIFLPPTRRLFFKTHGFFMIPRVPPNSGRLHPRGPTGIFVPGLRPLGPQDPVWDAQAETGPGSADLEAKHFFHGYFFGFLYGFDGYDKFDGYGDFWWWWIMFMIIHHYWWYEGMNIIGRWDFHCNFMDHWIIGWIIVTGVMWRVMYNLQLVLRYDFSDSHGEICLDKS